MVSKAIETQTTIEFVREQAEEFGWTVGPFEDQKFCTLEYENSDGQIQVVQVESVDVETFLTVYFYIDRDRREEKSPDLGIQYRRENNNANNGNSAFHTPTIVVVSRNEDKMYFTQLPNDGTSITTNEDCYAIPGNFTVKDILGRLQAGSMFEKV